jgi:hypothetical protein
MVQIPSTPRVPGRLIAATARAERARHAFAFGPTPEDESGVRLRITIRERARETNRVLREIHVASQGSDRVALSTLVFVLTSEILTTLPQDQTKRVAVRFAAPNARDVPVLGGARVEDAANGEGQQCKNHFFHGFSRVCRV